MRVRAGPFRAAGTAGLGPESGEKSKLCSYLGALHGAKAPPSIAAPAAVATGVPWWHPAPAVRWQLLFTEVHMRSIGMGCSPFWLILWVIEVVLSFVFWC
jgi:hypothetical protein